MQKKSVSKSTLAAGMTCAAALGSVATYHVMTRGIFGQIAQTSVPITIEKVIEKPVLIEKVVERPVYVNSTIEDSFILVEIDGVNGSSVKKQVYASRYLAYKQMSHASHGHGSYLDWVTYNDADISELAKYVTKDLATNEEKAKTIMDLVHAHMYDKTLEENKDYVKYPLETLVERGGDCEDLAILGAAMMKAVGIDVALIYIPNASNGADHVALGIVGKFDGSYYPSNGKNYYYAETTGTYWPFQKATWKIGDIPEEFKKIGAEIYTVR